MCIFTSVYKQCTHTHTQLCNPSLAHLFAVSEHVTEIVQQECIPVGCVPSAAVAVSPAMHAPCYAQPPLPCTPLLPCTPPHHTCPPSSNMPSFATHAPPPLPRTTPSPCMPPPPVNRILDTPVKTLPFHNYCCGR